MVKAKKKQKIVQNRIEKINQNLTNKVLSISLATNIATLQNLFMDDDTLITRDVINQHNQDLKYHIAYNDSMVNTLIITESIIKPLVISTVAEADIDIIMSQVVLISEVKKSSKLLDIIDAITYGNTVLLMANSDEALILNTKAFTTRGITEPDNEKVLTGPREGFSEALMPNLGLIRRRLRTNDLKIKFQSIGLRTNTTVCLCYLDSLVNRQVLQELKQRLATIKIDGVMDSNYLVELIKDNPHSPFRSIGFTERPDAVVANILEGRIAIFMDGTPIVQTVPFLFIENFQSSEDYYVNYYYASISRLLRFFSFILTLTLPGIYIAIVAFHREMLPTRLLVNIALQRHNAPLPAAAEALIMLIMFAILKEAGARMPSTTGSAMSIVGSLIVGQAAVEANFVAAPMIIVIATTGITSLLLNKLQSPIIYMQIFILIASSLMGYYGFVLAFGCILIHIFNLDSFGVQQVTLSGQFKLQAIKDLMIRFPLWQMIKRPKLLTDDVVRMKPKDGLQDD